MEKYGTAAATILILWCEVILAGEAFGVKGPFQMVQPVTSLDG
jgi:hypothetical protein